MKRGKLILVVGPAGVGKDTLINLYLENNPSTLKFISATTRKLREGEKEGVDYHFLSRTEFEKKIQRDEFLEYALVHNLNYYGTPKTQILKAIHEGRDTIGDIDYQGFLSIKKHPEINSEDLISVFILPPSIEILVQRIKNRGKMSDDELRERINSIERELSVADNCDIQITSIEGDIPKTYKLFSDEIKRKKVLC